MFYDKNKCDGCGSIMHDGEDIVVCPVCGTPQHRECYEKENKCVNEHLHSEGFKWKAEFVPEPSEPKERKTEDTEEPFGNTIPVMPITGTRAENIFLKNVLYDPNDEFDGVKVREAAVFFQQGAPRYIKKFIKNRDKKITWNWGAFFLTPFWFFYRKLYKAGLLFLCISITFSIALSTYVENKIVACPEFEASLEEYSQATEAFLTNFDEESSKSVVQKQDNLIKASRSNGHILLKTFAVRIAVILSQSIVAALLADYLLKKRLIRIVNLSREIPDENARIYSLARSGGVSYLMTLLALFVSMYLPDIIYSIADKIN